MKHRADIHSAFAHRFSFPRMNEVAPVTVEALGAIERELKTTFPSSYVSFILKHGPLFTPAISEALGDCEVCVPPEEEVFVVREFLTPTEIVRDYRICTEGGMPDWLIPFAMDFGGNLFGFRREEKHPRPDDAPVMVFDHDYCEIRPDAESFDEWLEYFLTLNA